ncbi:MAG: 3-hydroxybutyrate dehydrogenase [Sinobacteraceae bacterium]|nr:3-hydroxybutyrate dehydrogenase [Nevskiaceae bacterium]
MSSRAAAALVTGSSSGIGLSIARVLAGSGYNVVLTGLGDPQALTGIATAVAREYGVDTIYVPADLRNAAEIRALCERAQDRFGLISVLVNNAGVQHVAPVHEFPEEQWDEIIAVNLSSAFHTTKALLPAMQSARSGRIINIASAHGLVGSVGKSAYVASKHGIIGLTKVTALENASYGITANAICPGWVGTPLVAKQIAERAARSGRAAEEEQMRLITEKQALPQFTAAEHIADFVLFLCSPSAATITGAALSMDGGWVAS